MRLAARSESKAAEAKSEAKCGGGKEWEGESEAKSAGRKEWEAEFLFSLSLSYIAAYPRPVGPRKASKRRGVWGNWRGHARKRPDLTFKMQIGISIDRN